MLKPVQRQRRRQVELAVLLLIGLAPAEFNWLYLSRLSDRPVLFWLVDAGRFVVLPTIVFCWGLYRGLFRSDDLGLHGRVFGKSNDVLFVAVMVAVPMFLYWLDGLNLRIAAPFSSKEPVFSYAKMLPPAGPDTGLLRFLAVTYMAICAGVVEEFYYRGLVRIVCGRGRFGSVLFVLVSSALFAPPHWYGGVAKIVYVELFAIEAATIYLAIGNLWPLIMAHIIIDWMWLV